ncbi:hypothetical protein GGQ85_003926 [Nitrobacter vulgaris]|nr:hypothetical protein [Nitrobacter vulgaris]
MSHDCFMANEGSVTLLPNGTRGGQGSMIGGLSVASSRCWSSGGALDRCAGGRYGPRKTLYNRFVR